ncbi:MAG: hypothetical protein DBX61_05575 [Clostridiales bacterium]|nr:MAG: hypothetical protein DBX61_05575 [Clostridiales bacterium]
MKNIFARFDKMEKYACIWIKAGLAFTALCSAALFGYACKTQSILECMVLEKAIPSVIMSALIVVGGGFAMDALLKENKN